VTAATPDPKLPGVETIASQGAPGFAAYTRWGVFGPANMPPALAKRMAEELAQPAKAPAVTEKLSTQGMEVSGGLPVDLGGMVRKEIPRWAKVINYNNIKPGD